MTKKLFIKFSMLLFVLAMSTNVAWGFDFSNSTAYVASLKAQKSAASTGDGQVQLTLIDAQGNAMTESSMFGMMVGENALNATNPVGPAETAQLIGATLFAMDGIEVTGGEIQQGTQLYMTAYSYFKADAAPANGSYLDDWTFTEVASITRQDTAMDKTHPESAYFKLLPDTINSGKAGSDELNAAIYNVYTNPKNIYAVFKRYLLSNPVVTNNGTVTATEGDYTTINVSVDVEGDITQFKNDYADFVFPSYPTPATPFDQDDEGKWTWAMDDPVTEVISPTKMRAHVVVTYTAKAGITAGRHNTTLTISMAGEGASTLNIPLSVEVRPVSANEASVKIEAADPVEYATLGEAVSAANAASGDVTLTLLKDVSSAVTLTNTMTLDLNSYTLDNTLTVYGPDKTVTVAYNKQGGKITNPVTVAAGTLVLNGGTIAVEGENNVVAVAVAADANLIQNGATIIAEASQKGAVGIYNLGTVTINEGSIYAESGYNTAVAVNAENGSTTYINGGSLSALAKEEDGTETMVMGVTPEAISTWTNAYAVNVAAGSTVEVNGGDMYAEATNASRAYGVATLAGFGGTLTVNKKAVIRAKSPNTWYSFPVAVMAGQVTINGGKFDGHYTSPLSGDTINPAVFGVDYSNFTFKSGTCKTDEFFIENTEEAFAGSLLHPAVTLYKVTKGSKDYNDGYRNIAVADIINGNPATQADRIAAGVPAARIGTTGYTKLEDAIAYANNNPDEELVIFMQNNYTLPAGYYTLPVKATLVIPMSDEQSKEINAFPPRVSYNDMDRSHPYVEPTEFRRLTFASGVNMDVFGKIEMTCSQFASNEAYTAQPYGPYGHLVMEEGSHMTLQANSEVRAWGFMTGKGETDARRNATVREMFQLGDWKGAMTSVKITGMAPGYVADDSEKKIFPVSQYFIQNVESPVKYHPGAVLSTSAMVSEGLSGFLAVSMAATDIKIVGVNGRDSAIFVMDNGADADNTWVRKWYDVENDIQTYDINNAAHIGQMVLDMGKLDVSFIFSGAILPVKLNSAKFDLPLTCNFKIHLLSGSMDFQQNTSLLPGAEVEVDKEATVSVAMDDEEKDAYDEWKSLHAEWKEGGEEGNEPVQPVSYTGALYVYDAADWDEYAYCNEVDADGNSHKSTAYTKTVRYAPSWNGRPTKRAENVCPPSAAINVHGTFNTASGFVYTSEHGANVFSSNEDAGTFIFEEGASTAGTRTVNNVKGESTYESRTFYPAKLRNGNGTYAETESAGEGDAYCYINDEWTTMSPDENNPCFMVKHNVKGDVYYAKPADYVAVNATKAAGVFSGNEDHTYSDAAGAGRLFILMDDCQWWEVEKKDNLYHCTHPNNDTYYYWRTDTINKGESTERYRSYWAEKTYTITWKNWNGDIVKTADMNGDLQDSYSVTYGTMAEFLGTNPTRANNIDSTYNFTGWKPALGPVTQDVTYTATYETQPRMYTIIFNNEGGTEIERQFLEHNAVPVCENTPTKVGHYLVWDPAISPVIGDQIYTATWEEELPTEWDVTFVNNAGGVLKATEAVGINEHPTYTGSTPIKEAIDAEGNHVAYSSSEYTYTFWGWSAIIDGEKREFAAGAELPCPNAPTTYTAVYTEAQATYTITFKNGEETLFEKTDYHYGDMPACPANKIPADESDVQYTYTYAWSPQIQTVMGNQTYQWTSTRTTNKYTVTLTSNLSGVCTFTGAGTFEYGTIIDKVKVSYNDSKYTFNGWSDSEKNAAHPEFTLTGDVALTANFTPIALIDHTVATGDAWDVPADTEVKDLIITSDGSACGQLLHPENLTIRGEAIFRQQQSFAAGTWYAVAVPWRVNPATGIYGASSRLASGSQIYVIEFDGTAYAQVGGTEDTKQYWHFLHETGADMVPGKLYMVYLTSGQSKLDFHKKAGAALQTRNLTVSTASGSAGATFANWNAISNPALYTADLSTGVKAYQTYDNNDGQTYTVVDAATSGITVAKPIFVQVNTPGTVYATLPSGGSSAPAYRRAPQAEDNAKFVVEIAQDSKMTDRLIVKTTDEKENKYVIGQDLAKFGVSSKVAQMWINRYNAKLCVNTAEFDGERAEFPLSLYAPKAGEYTMSIQNSVFSDQMALYLTYNGEAIWNLSDGDYVAHLNKGTDNKYGLRVSARAPQITTGIDEAVVNAQGETRKVLINGQVFIIRGEKVYSVDGQLVK